MRRAFVPLLLAVLAIAGCQQQEIVGGKKREGTVNSVVSLAPGVTDILFKVGMVSLIRGRTASCDVNYGIGSAAIVVNGTTPNYEKIVALQPDLVVYDATLYSPAEIEKLKSLGLKTLELKANTVEGLVNFLYEIGKATAAESNASNLADKILSARVNAMSQAQEPRPQVAVLMADGSLYAAGKESFIADVVRSAGGDPVGPEGTTFVQTSPEQLLKLAPDVVFTPNGSGLKLLGNPQLASLPAVKAKQVYEVDDKTLLRVSTRIETLIEPMSIRLREAKVKAR
ncbi:MAG: ABC transporter substrate-binding protein [Fimbriimonadaceae bacterium]|nr:ABC transporter substrate-binding protein [Fimbriimonadaceae bacterium]